ncbi:MAG: glycosyltransferase family 39 protein, partial [Proteobacteria bacterium]|nr:glycosyltransferase family 39 protein [Pseudomonadota bacterium]
MQQRVTEPVAAGFRATNPVARVGPFSLGMIALLGLGVVLRLAFYSGFYGSDEVTYLIAAVRALNGDFAPSTYIGSIRYGFQLPMAGFMYLFGQSEATANAWTLVCSLAEIAVVVIIGKELVGARAAMLAGLLLATLPLHVHYAGRMMADPPLAFFMTSSFLLFWLGQHRGSAVWFFLAGLAAGCVFWIKETTVVYLLLFLIFPLWFRCWNWRWTWMVLGFVLVFGANLMFFWCIADDPFYVFRVARRAVSVYAGADQQLVSFADAPHFYLNYLLAKPYHTWLLGYLAFGGLILWRIERKRTEDVPALSFIVWWALGMLAIFSLLPVSLHPVKLIMKQVNYMLMFAAPLALLGGVALARVGNRALATLLPIALIPAIVLSAMERNVVSVFTANSKAALAVAKENPQFRVYGSIGAERAATFDALVHPNMRGGDIADMRDWRDDRGRGMTAYAVLDTETTDWGLSRAWRREDIPECWTPAGTIAPEPDTALPWVFSLIREAG